MKNTQTLKDAVKESLYSCNEEIDQTTLDVGRDKLKAIKDANEISKGNED